ncbi:MAG: choice-of-anchor R domain-containing protein, partial [bacterium]|nr:choice-of-anchor R domain-containing protein [bacterium]
MTTIILIFAVSLFVVALMVLSSLNDEKIARNALHAVKSFATGESGLEDILYRIKFSKQYNATETLSLNNGSATISSAASANEVFATSTGDVSGHIRRLGTYLQKSTSEVEFHYGVQVGEGGLVMENNSRVYGNVYSNGSIIGSPGAKITNDVWVAGGTQGVPNQEWTATTADFQFGRRIGSNDQLDIAQSFQTSTTAPINKISLYLKKVGVPPNVTVQINKNNGSEPGKNGADIITSGTLSANLVTANYAWVDVTFTSAPTLTASTTYWLLIDAARDDSNYWVIGLDGADAYPYGTGKWSPNWGAGNPTWNAAGGDFTFQIWMGGVETSIEGMVIGGNAHAHRIENTTVTSSAFSVIFIDSTANGDVSTDVLQDCSSSIDGDAAYNTKVNCTVDGVETTPNSQVPADPPPQNMPISQGQMDQLEDDAAAGGILNGDFTPGSSTSIGPKVINGNLDLTANGVVLTLTGTVHVKGYVDISNGSTVQLDSSYGAESGVLLADSWIEIANNGIFRGSGQSGSYVMLLSFSDCLGSGGSCSTNDAAIELHNNALGAIFYAAGGLIYVHNGVNATELTGYKMQLIQTASITYEQGLANAQFSAGPGASWQIQTWR